jgi:hypothetical protein
MIYFIRILIVINILALNTCVFADPGVYVRFQNKCPDPILLQYQDVLTDPMNFIKMPAKMDKSSQKWTTIYVKDTAGTALENLSPSTGNADAYLHGKTGQNFIFKGLDANTHADYDGIYFGGSFTETTTSFGGGSQHMYYTTGKNTSATLSDFGNLEPSSNNQYTSWGGGETPELSIIFC